MGSPRGSAPSSGLKPEAGPNPVPGSAPKTGFINALIIGEKFTGKGLGKEMMKRFLLATKTQYPTLLLKAALKNKKAISLYTKMKFQHHTTTMVLKR